jgi:HSP20 family protein
MANRKSLVPWRSNEAKAPAARDDFWDPFLSFRHEVDRMFDDFFEGAGWRPFGSGFGDVMPAVDVEEEEGELIVTAELPGVSQKDIEVHLSGDLLTIKGEKKFEREQRDGGSRRLERRFGSFERSIRLSFEVNDEKVDAKFSNGVLTIRLPKPPEMQRSSRRIEVRAS